MEAGLASEGKFLGRASSFQNGDYRVKTLIRVLAPRTKDKREGDLEAMLFYDRSVSHVSIMCQRK
eukprot:10174978-Alexandrium_andersonii.AAC.1